MSLRVDYVNDLSGVAFGNCYRGFKFILYSQRVINSLFLMSTKQELNKLIIENNITFVLLY